MREIDWTRMGSDTPSKYRFVLSFVLHSENGNLELKNAPLEWSDIELLIRRDREMHGVHITAVVESLTFIKEGAALIRELYESKGLFSDCALSIYYLDHETRTYVSLPTSYRLDFNTYKEIKLTKGINGVQIAAIEDGTVSKFQQRKDTTVNLNNLRGLSGFTIADYVDLRKALVMPEIEIYRIADFTNALLTIYEEDEGGTYFNYLTQFLTASDFEECQSVPFTTAAGYDKANALFLDNTEERILDITGEIKIGITNVTGTVSEIKVALDVIDTDNSYVDTIYSETFATGESGAKTITIDQTYTLPAGKSIVAVSIVTVDVVGSVKVDYQSCTLRFSETVETIATKQVDAMPLYEAVNRALQIILDQQNPLYSEFFGRTDLDYDAEDQLRFASILSGLHIRGAALPDAGIRVKFSELFKTLYAIWQVGGGFEFVDGVLKFRIEELAHFYQDTEILDLNTRVNQFEIEREQNSEAMYASLKSGFSKYTYEAINGRGEYNTVNNRTTVVPNDTEFDNTSPLRADTRGILALLNKPIGTEDVSGDEDVFIIKTQQDIYWEAETDENITIENGTSLFQTGSLNLYFTPTRNLIRHGSEINAGLALVPGTELTYQYADKNAALETTGEGYTVKENDDILASDLASPLWHPEILTVEVPFYEPDYVAVTTNPNGYITLSDDYCGWIKELRWKFAQNMATITLIRKICS